MENACFVESLAATNKPSVSAMGGQVWNRLQELKEEVTQDLLDEGPLCLSEPEEVLEERALLADSREIEWRHRSRLEARLRDITDAQDRILDGNYGKCIECGEQISSARLAADPVASLCLSCQRTLETETVFHTL